MDTVQTILFEPVGCLAEFPNGPFEQLALKVFDQPSARHVNASAAFWSVLDLLESNAGQLSRRQQVAIEGYEGIAVRRARPYDDVVPALAELRQLEVELVLASSLSEYALSLFLDSFELRPYFSQTWSRDMSGVKHRPLLAALAACDPSHTIFVTDTAGGLAAAKRVGVNAVLMMNDPDEAMRLTAEEPAGGIVSLHELPDLVRLVATQVSWC